MKSMFGYTDYQTSAHITSSGGHRWTALRIDVQAFIISVSFALVALFFQDPNRTAEELAMTAIGLQMTIEITRQFDMAIRWSVNLETNMVSVQRLLALANLPKERQELPEAASVESFDMSDLQGKIEFNNVEMRYKPELQPALQNLSFVVQPGERVAVIGRTGAGKSSIY